MGGVIVEDALTTLEAKARALGWGASLATLEDEDGMESILTLEYPKGRGKRTVRYRAGDAQAVLDAEFEHLLFLADYDAVVDVRTGEIEARLSGLDPRALSLRAPALNLPGLQFLDPETGEPVGDEEEEPTGNSRRRPWRIKFEGGPVDLELSPTSPRLMSVMYGASASFRAPGPSLKMRGLHAATSDETVARFEAVADSALFELDLKYGLGLRLMVRHPRTPRMGTKSSTSPPKFPTNRYASEPLALYRYARSAEGLPLLQFLAFYQALEYFFPLYEHAETIQRVRTVLADPRFDAKDESDLERVISVAGPSGRGPASEREQIRATVRGCVDPGSLRAFIESHEVLVEHLCSKRQAIQGVRSVALTSGDSDLRDQIADRVYAIRCRIVHTKQGGGDAGVDLLLPSSREARSLDPDISVVRYIAQQALISRAGPLVV